MRCKIPLDQWKILLNELGKRSDVVDTNAFRLLVALPAPSKGEPIKKVLWRKATEDKIPFSLNKWHKLSSRALRLVYRELSNTEDNQPCLEAYTNLVRNLLSFDLSHQAIRQIERAKTQLQSTDTRNGYYHLSQMKLSMCQDEVHLNYQRTYSPHLEHTVDHLDAFYLIEKLRLACDMKARSKAVGKGNYSYRMIKALRAEYTHELSQSDGPYPAAYLYAVLFDLLDGLPNSNYESIYGWLEQKGQIFPTAELKTIYQYLTNYLIGRVNRGDVAAYKSILQLYQFQLEKKFLLLESGYISQWTYANICTSAIRLGAFDWAEHFLEQYKSQLAPAVAHNAYSYNLASLHFSKQELDLTQDMLMQVSFTDAFYHLSAKLILLKIYYLKAEFEAMRSLAETTRLYLMRNRQLSAYQKRSIKNSIKGMVYLARAKEKIVNNLPAAKPIRKIRELLDKESELAQRGWLTAEYEKIS